MQFSDYVAHFLAVLLMVAVSASLIKGCSQAFSSISAETSRSVATRGSGY